MNFKRLYKNCISGFFYFYTRLAECDLDDIYCTGTDNINFGVLNSGKVCPRDFNIFTSVFQFSGHLLQLSLTLTFLFGNNKAIITSLGLKHL